MLIYSLVKRIRRWWQERSRATEPPVAPPSGPAALRAEPPSGSLHSDAVISVRGLRKAYGSFEAVRGIDLDVWAGEIFAFLGPNGAGKTTTVEILEGYRRRTAGEVRVLGVDPQRAPREWRDRIGVVLQESQPEPELTARECLRLYSGYYERPRPVDETLELVGLSDKADALVARLSGGQRRRLDVGLALIGDPELVFLDEPTTGFDPSARRAAWQVIEGLQALGKTILLTTHYMEEAEQLADRIAVIAAGEIVAEGTPHTLGGRDRSAAEITFTLPVGVATEELPPALRAEAQKAADGLVLLRSEQPMPILHELSEWALEHSYALHDIDVRRPTLEEIYLQLTTGRS